MLFEEAIFQCADVSQIAFPSKKDVILTLKWNQRLKQFAFNKVLLFFE